MRIAVGDGTVVLDGAGPNVGFKMEVDNDGPRRVKIEFEAEEHHSKFEARFEDGELVIHREEED